MKALEGWEAMSVLAPPPKIENLFDKNKTKLSTCVDKAVNKSKLLIRLILRFNGFYLLVSIFIPGQENQLKTSFWLNAWILIQCYFARHCVLTAFCCWVYKYITLHNKSILSGVLCAYVDFCIIKKPVSKLLIVQNYIFAQSYIIL